MRWLLLKDLQILRRSPLLVGLLVVYGVAIATLLGVALTRGPGKPEVAFANLVPPSESRFTVGGEQLEISRYAERLFQEIEPVRVASREEALEKVRNGEVQAALVVPADATRRLQSTIDLAGGDPPVLELYYNAEDPIKRRRIEQTIAAQLAEANGALSGQLTKIAGAYISIIVEGGDFSLLGQRIQILGLKRAKTIVDATITRLPAGSAERIALQQVSRFAGLAADNLDVSKPILASIGSPVRVRRTVLEGSRSPLDVYLAAVAVATSLMIVTLLLSAGMLALEREQNTFPRLVRGLVSRTQLVAEKVVLGALCSLVLGLLMLLALALFVDIPLDRAPLWVPVTALAALAFGALGVAVGALAREVRTASLLAILLALPIAALGLIPRGSVTRGLERLVEAVSAAFPFKPALDALDAAISGGALAWPLAHLALLTLAFGGIARLSLRRFY